MSDLIPRDAAIEAAIDGVDEWDGGCNFRREKYIERHMLEVPAIDAVMVVRCRDCKWRITGNPDMDCEICAGREDWFCAGGEKK